MSVATGKDLKGTGVWSFIKIKATPVTRASIAAVLAAAAYVIGNPEVVSALTSDSSINN